MRVAIFIERLNVGRGGRERSTIETAVRLVRRGCEVAIVCMRASVDVPAGQPSIIPPGMLGKELTIVELGEAGPGRAGRMRNFIASAREIAQGRQYDITHAMLPVPGASVYQLRSGTAPGLLEAHLRRFGPAGRLFRKLTWPINRTRAALAALEAQVVADSRTWCLPVSRMVAGELQRFYGRSERVRVVFNAASVPQVSPADRLRMRNDTRRTLGVGADDFLLLCPAMNFQLKGVRQAIQALSRFQARRGGPRTSQLVVLGREMPEGYQRLASMESVGSQVKFLGPASDIWPMYAAADAVVLLSWYDPCSRVVLEAIGFGTPCITTAFNGAGEAMDGAGIVVPSPADLSAVAAAYERLADPAQRGLFIEGCRRAGAVCNDSRYVDELLAVYKEAAAT